MTTVFIGIDVACAKKKRLPVCFVHLVDGQPEPLALDTELRELIPRGIGNAEVMESVPFGALATRTATAIETICAAKGWTIARFGIDAPAEPPRGARRQCELALTASGLSVFATPPREEWEIIKNKCRAHLTSGLPLSRLPHANKIWMLYGFELFAALRGLGFNTIEVYPQAIAHALIGHHPHKSTEEGYRKQLDAVATRTGREPLQLEDRLRNAVAGTRHDRLDAFMAAWVASLPRDRMRAYGNGRDAADSIWVPLR